ncbi:MAG TPA: hypothetical protein VFF31_26700 [Blastocatellia bacterium]|nr:hypothetical protein [Blastocatellia bacterium]
MASVPQQPKSHSACLMTLTGHTGWVTACAFSPNGRLIVSASTDKTLKLWDAQTGTELASLVGHNGVVRSCEFSPDASRIVSASDDNTLKLWDAQTGGELATLGVDPSMRPGFLADSDNRQTTHTGRSHGWCGGMRIFTGLRVGSRRQHGTPFDSAAPQRLV